MSRSDKVITRSHPHIIPACFWNGTFGTGSFIRVDPPGAVHGDGAGAAVGQGDIVVCAGTYFDGSNHRNYITTVNIHNAASPSILGHILDPVFAYDQYGYLDGNYWYSAVASGGGGTQIAQNYVSNTGVVGHLATSGSYPVPYYRYARPYSFGGNKYVIVGSGSTFGQFGFEIYDITSFPALGHMSSLYPPSGGFLPFNDNVSGFHAANGIFVSNRTLDNFRPDGTLWIYDIGYGPGSISSPILKFSSAIGSYAQIRSVQIDGTHLWFGGFTSTKNYLSCLDISNLASPSFISQTELGSVSQTYDAVSIRVCGDILFMQRDVGVFNVYAYDISDPSAPVEVDNGTAGGSNFSTGDYMPFTGRRFATAGIYQPSPFAADWESRLVVLPC